MTKRNPSAKLLTLPAEDQLVIFEWMKHGSYKAVRVQIRKEYGVSVSQGACSYAYQEWSRKDLEERVLKSKGAAEDVLELIDNPEQLDDALTLALKQSAFEMVMNGGNEKSIKSFCTILLQSEKLKHDQASLDLKLRQYEDQINAAKADLAKGKSEGGMSVEAIEEMEERLGLL